jgi:prevent-host-death family protein
MQETTVRDLQARIGDFTRSLRRGETVKVTDRGEPLAVALPWREWEAMQNKPQKPLDASRVSGPPIEPDRAVKLYAHRMAQQILDQCDGQPATARRVLLAALMELEEAQDK